MKIEIKPEPTEAERRAIDAALRGHRAASSPYDSPWRAAALADLRDGLLAEESRSDPGVVEP